MNTTVTQLQVSIPLLDNEVCPLKPKRPLPDDLGNLLRVALDDVQLIRKDKRYVLDFSVWHQAAWTPRRPCHVCLAGAVLAKEFKVPANKNAFPIYTTENDKLLMLNRLRCGAVWNTLVEHYDLRVLAAPNNMLPEDIRSRYSHIEKTITDLNDAIMECSTQEERSAAYTKHLRAMRRLSRMLIEDKL